MVKFYLLFFLTFKFALSSDRQVIDWKRAIDKICTSGNMQDVSIEYLKPMDLNSQHFLIILAAWLRRSVNRVGKKYPETVFTFGGSREPVSPDLEVQALGFGSSKIKLQRFLNGEIIKEWKAHSRDIEALKFSPDGALLASFSYYDNAVKVWDVKSCNCVSTQPIPSLGNVVAYWPDVLFALLNRDCSTLAKLNVFEKSL